MSSQGDRPRHDRAAGQHGSGLRAADKRVNMAGAHCVCDGEVYGTNEVLRRRVKDSVILYSFGVCRYAWAFSKRMSRGTGCVNCARPGLWGSPSGNRGALPGKAVASSMGSACAWTAVLPCCAGFYEGVLRQSPLRETSFPRRDGLVLAGRLGSACHRALSVWK